jgi:hypothetical protein
MIDFASIRIVSFSKKEYTPSDPELFTWREFYGSEITYSRSSNAMERSAQLGKMAILADWEESEEACSYLSSPEISILESQSGHPARATSP